MDWPKIQPTVIPESNCGNYPTGRPVREVYLAAKGQIFERFWTKSIGVAEKVLRKVIQARSADAVAVDNLPKSHL
jgi:hypothetical protein